MLSPASRNAPHVTIWIVTHCGRHTSDQYESQVEHEGNMAGTGRRQWENWVPVGALAVLKEAEVKVNNCRENTLEKTVEQSSEQSHP